MRSIAFFTMVPLYVGIYVTIVGVTLAGAAAPPVGLAAAGAFAPVSVLVKTVFRFYFGGIDETIR